MSTNTLDLMTFGEPDTLAIEIAGMFDKWKSSRAAWEVGTKELRDYLYATDTSTTSNSKLPFMNSITVPKLTQLAENLQSNYVANMFPNDDWINWEAHNKDAALEDKRISIESYIRTKARQQQLPMTFATLISDWILYGNCFAQIEYVNEEKLDEETGEVIPGYIGPRVKRISPYDIVFNVTATSFKRSPKIIRKLLSFGEIYKLAKTHPELGYSKDLIAKISSHRAEIMGHATRTQDDSDKSTGLIADGFGSIEEYYNTDLVEVLEFYGDFFERESLTLHENRHIVVVDRRMVIRDEPIKSWMGSSYIHHSAWRSRPDNLLGMGPLDNLVGMQYKLDKLENIRADIFDKISHPVIIEIGRVEYFSSSGKYNGRVRGEPGSRYIVEDAGDVKYLQPDATALTADVQLAQTMMLMEELAGAPKEALGIRSPGEKTAFEVQKLDNAASRIFRKKTELFETQFIEPILNDMLEMSRRNLNGIDLVRQEDSVFGTDEFLSITKEDITAVGKLYPRGSKHFAQQANAMQNLNAILNSAALPLISPHLSRIQLAKIIEDLMGAEKFKLIQENVGITEDLDSKRLAQAGDAALAEEDLTDTGGV